MRSACPSSGSWPRDKRDESLIFDIGSGNTKFGFATRQLGGGWQTTSNSVAVGTNTFAERVLKANQTAGPREFGEAVKPIRSGLDTALKDERFAAPARDKVYMTGGIVWAMVSLVRPEDADAKEVEITLELLDRFLARVRSADPKGLIPSGPRSLATKGRRSRARPSGPSSAASNCWRAPRS